jgi:hypothetical protein
MAAAAEDLKDIQVYAKYYAKYSMDNQDALDDYLNISFLLKDEGKNIAIDGNFVIMVTTDRGFIYAKEVGSLKSSDFVKKVIRWPTDQEITTTTIRSPEISINGSKFINIEINKTNGKYENLGHKAPYGSGTVSIVFTDQEGTRFVGESRIQFRGPKY